MSHDVTSDYIWWDGRYLPKGEPWGEVQEVDSNGPFIFRVIRRVHGVNSDTEYYSGSKLRALAAVEQWVREPALIFLLCSGGLCNQVSGSHVQRLDTANDIL